MNKKLSTQYLLATFTVALFCTQLLVAQSRSVDKVSTPPNKRDNHTSNPSKDLTIRPIDGHAQSTISDDRDSSRPKRPGDEQRDSVDDVKKVYEVQETELYLPTHEQDELNNDGLESDRGLRGVKKSSPNNSEIIETIDKKNSTANTKNIIKAPISEFIIKEEQQEEIKTELSVDEVQELELYLPPYEQYELNDYWFERDRGLRGVKKSSPNNSEIIETIDKKNSTANTRDEVQETDRYNPVNKQSELGPEGHDINPDYVEQEPVNDVIKSVVPNHSIGKQESFLKTTVTPVTPPRATTFKKDFEDEDLQQIFSKYKNKQDLTELEEEILNKYFLQPQPRQLLRQQPSRKPSVKGRNKTKKSRDSSSGPIRPGKDLTTLPGIGQDLYIIGSDANYDAVLTENDAMPARSSYRTNRNLADTLAYVPADGGWNGLFSQYPGDAMLVMFKMPADGIIKGVNVPVYEWGTGEQQMTISVHKVSYPSTSDGVKAGHFSPRTTF